jgi:hypothetical protein
MTTLQNNTALVTGTSGGIGRSTAAAPRHGRGARPGSLWPLRAGSGISLLRAGQHRSEFSGPPRSRLRVHPLLGSQSVVKLPPNASASSASLKTSPPISSTTILRLSALGLRRDPHGSVKQIHHEELKDGDKERPSAFPKIMLKQTDSGIQQLHGAGERTQDQQRRRRLLVDRPQCEQSQRNCARRRVHRQ